MAAKDLAPGQTLSGSSADVVANARIAVHARHRDAPENSFSAPVTTAIETVALGLPDNAGKGVMPQSAAKEASDGSRSGCRRQAHAGPPATSGPTPYTAPQEASRNLLNVRGVIGPGTSHQ
jgi:hypothetical protein